jgi:hypothetical protein
MSKFFSSKKLLAGVAGAAVCAVALFVVCGDDDSGSKNTGSNEKWCSWGGGASSDQITSESSTTEESCTASGGEIVSSKPNPKPEDVGFCDYGGDNKCHPATKQYCQGKGTFVTTCPSGGGGNNETYCDYGLPNNGGLSGECYKADRETCADGWGYFFQSQSACNSGTGGEKLEPSGGGGHEGKFCCYGPGSCYAIGSTSQDYKTEADCEAREGAEVRDEYWEMEAGDVQGYCSFAVSAGQEHNCWKQAKSQCDANQWGTFYATRAEAETAGVLCDW